MSSKECAFWLGHCYFQGLGTDKDPELGLKIWKHGARAFHPLSADLRPHVLLLVCGYSGADNGDPYCQYTLGGFAMKGVQGMVAQDTELAAEYLSKCLPEMNRRARQHDVHALHFLGVVRCACP